MKDYIAVVKYIIAKHFVQVDVKRDKEALDFRTAAALSYSRKGQTLLKGGIALNLILTGRSEQLLIEG